MTAEAFRYTFTEWDLLGAESDPFAAAGLASNDCTCARGFTPEDVRWPDDDASVDYRHVGAPRSDASFRLTPAVLQALCDANAFAVPPGRVLFGLRGCVPVVAPDGSWAEAVEVREAVPDHVDFRCVLGVWDRDAGRVCVFRGSTVPNRIYVWAQACGCRNANLLLTGLHRYEVGTHHGTQLGAFRLPAGDDKAILRSRTDPVLANTDPVLVDRPSDNIHCSYFRSDEGVRFSSAGCQTVYGSWDAKNKRHVDPPDEPGWATFRQRAGLEYGSYGAEATADPQDGTAFSYVLLTGREARLAAEGTSLPRLRYGSGGPAVEALQQALGVAADGQFGARTADAFTTWQRRTHGWADGIARPGDLGP